MRSRVSIITGVIALAICLVCPLIDLFDQWDHALQTGNDTEYPLVVLALCVGAAIVLSRLMITVSLRFSVARIGDLIPFALSSLPFFAVPTLLVTAPGSPPLSLRI